MKNVKLYLHSKNANVSGKTGVKRFYIKDISRGSPYIGTTKLSVETLVVFNTVPNLSGTYVLEMDQIQNYSYDSNLDGNSMVIGVISHNGATFGTDTGFNYHPTYQNAVAPVEIPNPLGTEIQLNLRSLDALGVASEVLDCEFYVVLNLDFGCNCGCK
jgi:hypothetical protein